MRSAVASALLVAVLSACASEEGPARIEPEHVVYDGEAYGDFLILAELVRGCVRSDVRTLPRIVLVDELFDCYTTRGWKKALGCTGEGQSVMVAEVLVASSGALWSHELVHYFGIKAEGDPCATLALQGFSLEARDGGL